MPPSTIRIPPHTIVTMDKTRANLLMGPPFVPSATLCFVIAAHVGIAIAAFQSDDRLTGRGSYEPPGDGARTDAARPVGRGGQRGCLRVRARPHRPVGDWRLRCGPRP